MIVHKIFIVTLLLLSSQYSSAAESDEDKRCICICPSPSAVFNNTGGSRSHHEVYTVNVPPHKCNCDGVVLPRLENEIKGKEQEFCPRCKCSYEIRNTTIIKVVVIIVIWIITLLVVYMGFLICLDPLLNKRTKASYQEHTNEDDDGFISPGGSAHPMGIRGNVLNRVGHQQDKWKQQVREQRRNIYDRHTMLN